MIGWDRAQVPPGGGILPLFGGYPDGFWIDGVSDWDRAGRKQYFFGLEHDDSIVGADLKQRPGTPDTSVLSKFPYGACEIGGGMEVSYRRRPVIGADDVAAEALVKLGSGSNLQGYYMYHGGADPIGQLSTLNETRATGYPNDMPAINYDFQAPLGEYGQLRPTYDALRIQHLFLADYGAALAALPAVYPDQRPTGLDDRDTLRWSMRADSRHGFIFVNNYQHLESLPAHEDVQFQVRLATGFVAVPTDPISIPSGRYFIWPVNLPVGGAILTYSTAQPLCVVGDTYVFFAPDGIAPEFAFDPRSVPQGARARIGNLTPGTDCIFPVASRDGGREVRILVLTEEQAHQAWRARIWGADRLFLSTAGLIFDGDTLRVQSRQPTMAFSVFPAPPLQITGTDDGLFGHFVVSAAPHPVKVELHRIATAGIVPPVRTDAKGAAFAPDETVFAGAAGSWQVSLPRDALQGVHEVFLRVDYAGDIGRAYVGDRLIDDDFYFGRPWEIGLSRFAPEILEQGLTLRILPLRRDAPIYLPKDRWPGFDAGGQAAEIRGITAEPLYEVAVSAATAK
jgi:beta-galactosidase